MNGTDETDGWSDWPAPAKLNLFLRITGPGDYRYEGADLGILITRGRVMTPKFELNDRALAWIRGIKQYYAARPLTSVQATEAPAPGSFKIL